MTGQPGVNVTVNVSTHQRHGTARGITGIFVFFGAVIAFFWPLGYVHGVGGALLETAWLGILAGIAFVTRMALKVERQRREAAEQAAAQPVYYEEPGAMLL